MMNYRTVAIRGQPLLVAILCAALVVCATAFAPIAPTIRSPPLRAVEPLAAAPTGYQNVPAIAAFATAMAPFAAHAADVDSLELSELPPVYVPILFAIGIIGGVGVLTASLGNVMDEEASLGLQSGARAKKERDRNRSSYFKK